MVLNVLQAAILRELVEERFNLLFRGGHDGARIAWPSAAKAVCHRVSHYRSAEALHPNRRKPRRLGTPALRRPKADDWVSILRLAPKDGHEPGPPASFQVRTGLESGTRLSCIEESCS